MNWIEVDWGELVHAFKELSIEVGPGEVTIPQFVRHGSLTFKPFGGRAFIHIFNQEGKLQDVKYTDDKSRDEIKIGSGNYFFWKVMKSGGRALKVLERFEDDVVVERVDLEKAPEYLIELYKTFSGR